eukprot:TRINITY_DN9189_c0_g1_i1.p1 TRINITY_DN9189_c0_g1~~TRINITY_DN9189_c0_g1_i1.p1  ORF type:complete len:393 (+),score=118.69 TRINITY_DN9189_c0_g1_i1:61-1179(+)
MADERPSVLVLGGTGFIGKHLVKYLTDYDIASKVRVADKRPPVLSYVDDDFAAAFQKVEFVQADLATAAHKAWGDDRFSIVINLASSMEFGKPDVWYEMNILKVRQECAKIAAERGCDKYVEVSTTSVYKPKDEKGTKASKEGDAEEPGNVVSRRHLEAEKWVLENCPQLPVIIVRLPVVYGPADVHGLMPRLLCAASYIQAGEPMEFLYSEDLRVNTLHVQDAVGGIWFLICSGQDREVYNLVDDSDTTQKKLNKVMQEVFPIECKCVGHMGTKAALTLEKLEVLLEGANDEHGRAWSALCRDKGADPCGPLTTFLHEEDLTGRPNAAKNDKSKAAGYTYTVPELTADYVRHALQYWTNVRGKVFFPNVMR